MGVCFGSGSQVRGQSRGNGTPRWTRDIRVKLSPCGIEELAPILLNKVICKVCIATSFLHAIFYDHHVDIHEIDIIREWFSCKDSAAWFMTQWVYTLRPYLTKWLRFCRRHFQMHFSLIAIVVLFQFHLYWSGYNWHLVSIGLDTCVPWCLTGSKIMVKSLIIACQSIIHLNPIYIIIYYSKQMIM